MERYSRGHTARLSTRLDRFQASLNSLETSLSRLNGLCDPKSMLASWAGARRAAGRRRARLVLARARVPVKRRGRTLFWESQKSEKSPGHIIEQPPPLSARARVLAAKMEPAVAFFSQRVALYFPKQDSIQRKGPNLMYLPDSFAVPNDLFCDLHFVLSKVTTGRFQSIRFGKMESSSARRGHRRTLSILQSLETLPTPTFKTQRESEIAASVGPGSSTVLARARPRATTSLAEPTAASRRGRRPREARSRLSPRAEKNQTVSSSARARAKLPSLSLSLSLATFSECAGARQVEQAASRSAPVPRASRPRLPPRCVLDEEEDFESFEEDAREAEEESFEFEDSREDQPAREARSELARASREPREDSRPSATREESRDDLRARDEKRYAASRAARAVDQSGARPESREDSASRLGERGWWWFFLCIAGGFSFRARVASPPPLENQDSQKMP